VYILFLLFFILRKRTSWK